MSNTQSTPVSHRYSKTFDYVRSIIKQNDDFELKELRATTSGMRAIVKDKSADDLHEKFYEITVNVIDYKEG